MRHKFNMYLADTFPRCKQNDPNLNECLRQATQTAVDVLRGGVPSLSIASLDPLKVTSISIGQGEGPISISMKFSDITVTGISDTILNKTTADLKNYSLRFEGGIKKPILEADYDMTGRILLLPVTGKGRCKLIFTNLQAVCGPSGKGIIKKGKKYYDVTDFYLNIYNVDKLEVHFDNLFNNDKTLGDSMNSLLNENWKDFWSELKPAFDQSFGAILHHYAKGVFDKVAFNDVFLE